MNRYKIISQLGEQSQGFISQAENVETGERVVIKQYKKKFYTWQDCMHQREIKVLRIFNHPNIVKLRELIKEGHTLYSVYEYTDQNLFEFYQNLRDSNGQFTETEIKSIMYQIFSGLHYTHKMHFFHRDLCLENIFINHDTQQVKISNFSQAREMQTKGSLTDYITTRWYRAPEQLLHSQTYNYKVDLWAAGCIMAELFLLGPLFGGSSESDQLWRIIKIMGTPSDWPEFYSLINNLTKKQGSVPKYDPQNLSNIIPNASKEAIDLLKKLLVFNPSKRYSGLQALKHPFFTGQSLISGQNTPQGYNLPKSPQNQNQKMSNFAKQQNQTQQQQQQQTQQPIISAFDPAQLQEQQQQTADGEGSQKSSGRIVPNTGKIDNIQEQEEDDNSSQDSQNDNAVPLDVQQYKDSLKRPGSRDCNRDQRDQNEKIKHEKELGSIHSGSHDDEDEEVNDLEFNPDLRNNNDIVISVTHGQKDAAKLSFSGKPGQTPAAFLPQARASKDLTPKEINQIINRYKSDSQGNSGNNSPFARQDQNDNNNNGMSMVQPIVKISDENEINEAQEEEENQQTDKTEKN